MGIRERKYKQIDKGVIEDNISELRGIEFLRLKVFIK
jgi:hypothetical protein